MFQDPYTWVILSFALFCVIAWKFGRPQILKSLDDKIAVIRKEIETSERLRAEAQALLLDFQQRQKQAEQESERLINQASVQAEHFREREEKRLNDLMKQKEQQLTERLNLLRDQAVDEIRQVAAGLAFEAAQKMVTQKLDADTKSRLIDRALDHIAQRLN
jgi:F-type H+-transporting ATPase subunit b